ncbi:unnamed protein product [Mytilus coruscus]|uniref:Uncharacterized protein n=1 Tax=Mytilus coruscus TaxID=42192 RepID=A0A6J8EDA2_MYTCO|nr:unnamed protein product [Mytilus coruscus]
MDLSVVVIWKEQGYFGSSFIMLGVAKSYGILMKPLMDEFNVDITIASLGNAVMAGTFTLADRHLVFDLDGIGAGIGNSCLDGNGVVMIGCYFKRIRTVANGIALSGASVGTFVIPPLMEFLLKTYGLQGTYLILGGLYLFVAVSGALYRPLTFYSSERKAGENDEKHKLIKEDLNDSSRKGTNVVQDTTNQVISRTCDTYTDLEIQIDSEVNQEKSVSFFTSNGSSVGSMESLAQVVLAEDFKKLSSSIAIKIFGKSLLIPKIFHFSVLKMPKVSFLVFFGYFNFILCWY